MLCPPVCPSCRRFKQKNLLGEYYCPPCTDNKLVEEILAPENKCLRCDGAIFPYEKYCAGCGKGNPRFDELEIIGDWEMTLAEWQEENCFRGGHVELRGILKFCSFCGIKL